MKVSLLVFLLLLSSRGFGLCLPDSLESVKALGELAVLETEAQRFEASVREILPREHDLMVQLTPLNPRTNAEVTKKDNQIVIEIMGGMLNHPRMSDHAFKLLLCHEFGHVSGGPPLKSRGGWSSTEGQADYYSGFTCAKQLGMDEASFLSGALELTSIYAEVMRQPYPRLDSCDEGQVQRINFGYPSVQCRLDTLLAGWKEEPRPVCWFKE